MRPVTVLVDGGAYATYSPCLTGCPYCLHNTTQTAKSILPIENLKLAP